MNRAIIAVVVLVLVLAPGASAQFVDGVDVPMKVKKPIVLTVTASTPEIWADEVGNVTATVWNPKNKPQAFSWQAEVVPPGPVAVLPGGVYEYTLAADETRIFEWQVHPNGIAEWEGILRLEVVTR